MTDVERAAQLLGRPSLLFRRVLTGGEHARTIVAGDDDGDVVVRRFPPGDTAGENELMVTRLLGRLGDLAPRLLGAADDVGDGALLITELVDGTPPRRDVSDAALADGLAKALARIHSVSGNGLPEAPVRAPAGDHPIARLAQERFPDLDVSERVLTHLDFWTGNTLWRDDNLVSVVDWSGAKNAPRGVDLAWVRQDLVLQGRAAAADLLLDRYRATTGVAVDDIWDWDVQAAAYATPVVGTWSANYVGIGLTDLTPQVLEDRLAAWNEHLMQEGTFPHA